jgi:NADH-quinone oxidoreductase subunit L
VLAYSTISQLGFMVAAIGTAGLGLVAGLFHMVTHAFFKACLFLSAGSVIHGCHHEQDMQKMGGLRKKMPLTFIAMMTCTLAIAGMPLFSGFYSKDRIIQSAIQSTFAGGSFRGSSAFATVALALAAALTAFYMFRLIFLTFFGEARDHHIYEHAHESPKTMTISLLVLATFGLLGGHFWLGGDFLSSGGTWFTNMVGAESMYPGITLTNYHEVGAHLEHTSHLAAMAVSTVVMLTGIGVAFWIYFLRKTDPARITGALGEIYTTVKNKYYIDEVVNASLIKGTMKLASAQSWFDAHIVDGIVLTVGKVNKAAGFVSAWFDRTFIDGMVNLVGTLAHAFGYAIRLLQTGRIQQYVSFAVAGGILAAAVFILS